ncbi:rhodanese-related sulfurtransferase [Rubritalea marina]|uniref:oxygen-dependent tRNA uridine(34) hydroxylase TrhO n=1 Tax=Rubritalea marina TaxID=361055 RepID=UPI00036F61F6|nr:rhodanese-related sulfurtransferase [Rubritalea marina]
MQEAPYQVLLYYLYTDIESPQEYRDAHKALCDELELRGRIIVGSEGINGTVSGTVENCKQYMEAMYADPMTQDIEFKIDPEQGHVFPKMSVKARDEIVTLGLGEEDFSPNECTGKYLDPKAWREAIRDPDAVIIDARNDYEWDLGHFKGAIRPPVPAFRDLPQWIRDNYEKFDGKKILTYCTGGIRCEKFSGFLVKEGFEDVSQLHGGIVKYGKDPEVKGEDFDGQCYVFDQRIGVPVNQVNPNVVARCVHCDIETERYVNCANKMCNAQHFCCEACEAESKRCCCDACRDVFTKEYEGVLQ